MARKRKRFRKAPAFGRMQKPLRMYGRFYVLYRTKTGITKRGSFMIRINPRSDRRVQHRMIITIVKRILNKEIPVHKAGQVFSYFELMTETPWIKVRKLLKYEAGAVYER